VRRAANADRIAMATAMSSNASMIASRPTTTCINELDRTVAANSAARELVVRATT
jgi:hypothetical protein